MLKKLKKRESSDSGSSRGASTICSYENPLSGWYFENSKIPLNSASPKLANARSELLESIPEKSSIRQ